MFLVALEVMIYEHQFKVIQLCNAAGNYADGMKGVSYKCYMLLLELCVLSSVTLLCAVIEISEKGFHVFKWFLQRNVSLLLFNSELLSYCL